MPQCENCGEKAVKTYKCKFSVSIGDRVENIVRHGAVCVECYNMMYNDLDDFIATMAENGITQEEAEKLSKV